MVTCERSFSTALLARYSCTKPSIVLPSTTASTMTGIGPLPDDGGDNRGEDEDENQRAFELAQEQPQRGGLLLGSERVQPVLLQTLLGVRRLEAVAGGVQRGKELLGREAPISRRSSLGVLLPRVVVCGERNWRRVSFDLSGTRLSSRRPTPLSRRSIIAWACPTRWRWG